MTLLAICILFCSTFIRSAFGFGDALVAMPLLVMAAGLRTATPLVAMAASTIGVTILVRNFRSVRLKSAWRLILSSLLGIPLGLFFLKGAYEGILEAALACLILAFSSYNLIRPRRLSLKTEKSSWAFGFLAGVLGGAYNTNGPLVVIYGSLRRWPPAVFRATLQGYFVPTGLCILLGHGASGLWTGEVARLFAFSLPAVFLAIFLGGRLHRAIPEGRFDRCIHALLLVIGAALLAQSIRS